MWILPGGMNSRQVLYTTTPGPSSPLWQWNWCWIWCGMPLQTLSRGSRLPTPRAGELPHGWKARGTRYPMRTEPGRTPRLPNIVRGSSHSEGQIRLLLLYLASGLLRCPAPLTRRVQVLWPKSTSSDPLRYSTPTYPSRYMILASLPRTLLDGQRGSVNALPSPPSSLLDCSGGQWGLRWL